MILSPFVFIIVFQAITAQFKTDCLYELLHVDVLVFKVESIVELEKKFLVWKENLESKGFKVNLVKSKFLVSKETYSTSFKKMAQYVGKVLVEISYGILSASYGYRK